MSKAKFSAGDKVKHAKHGLFSSSKSYSILKYATEKFVNGKRMTLCSDDETKEEIWIPDDELALIQKAGS